jgi:NAD(P) transhydrogenase subunit alpha
MRPGSVIVDLAAETGGNCELTEPGQTVVKEDVTIVGPANLASTMPDHASSLYARNVQSLLELMVNDGELTLDFEDEIIKGACITRDGEIVHEGARNAAGGGPAQPDRSSGAGGGASISERGAGGPAEVS